jgi:pimeloyl-ACP methyl ester carboxylesterase
MIDAAGDIAPAARCRRFAFMFTETDAADLFRAAPHRLLELDDVSIAHRVVGTGPALLFVHGWPVSGATFRRLLPHLVEHRTCHLLDLPGAGDSRWSVGASLSLRGHIGAVRRAVELLELDDVTAVGHDSGGLIARHALAGDERVRSMVLIDTEHPHGQSLAFRAFTATRHLPGIAPTLGRIAGSPRLARSRAVFGGAFVDRSLLGGEFDEFFLTPLRRDRSRREAAAQVLRTFEPGLVTALAEVHPRIDVPVHLVWGESDPFFPVRRAREMVGEFPDARLTVVPGAALFVHEERPADVAAALLEGSAPR